MTGLLAAKLFRAFLPLPPICTISGANEALV
jgi:hypothetical protein